MSPGDPHPEVAEELRRLAQAILDRLDPAVRAAATRAAEGLGGPGRCQQVWCPVCALAALVTGEQHPLLTVVAEHSVALLTVIRSMTAQTSAAEGDGPGDGPADGPSDGATTEDSRSEGSARGGYQHIAFTIEPVPLDTPAVPPAEAPAEPRQSSPASAPGESSGP